MSAEQYYDDLLVNINAGTVDISDAPLTVDTINSVAVSNAGINQLRAATWITLVQHVFTVTFTTEDLARAFFNTGGQIRLLGGLTGQTGSQSDAWKLLIDTAGQIIFDQSDYYALATAATPTVLHTSSSPGVYSDNTYTISVQPNALDASGRGDKGKVLTFRIIFDDSHVGFPGDPVGSDVINGNLTTTIDYRNVDGTPLTLTPPVFLTTTALTAGS